MTSVHDKVYNLLLHTTYGRIMVNEGSWIVVQSDEELVCIGEFDNLLFKLFIASIEFDLKLVKLSWIDLFEGHNHKYLTDAKRFRPIATHFNKKIKNKSFGLDLSILGETFAWRTLVRQDWTNFDAKIATDKILIQLISPKKTVYVKIDKIRKDMVSTRYYSMEEKGGKFVKDEANKDDEFSYDRVDQMWKSTKVILKHEVREVTQIGKDMANEATKKVSGFAQRVMGDWW